MGLKEARAAAEEEKWGAIVNTNLVAPRSSGNVLAIRTSFFSIVHNKMKFNIPTESSER